MDTAIEVVDQPFDVESVGDSEDADLVPFQSGEDWVAQLDDDLSRPASQSGENFRITAQDATCIALLTWIRSDVFPPWSEVKALPGTTLIVASSEQSFGGHKWRDMAEEEFSRLGIAVVGTQTSAGAVISGLSCVTVWRPFGS